MSFRTWFENVKSSSRLNVLRQAHRRSPLRKRDFSFCFQAAEIMEERRLLSAGALDPTFGSGGIATPTASIAGTATALAVYSNAHAATAGDVVAAGGMNAEENADPNAFAVVRYLPNGKPDPTFGSGGEVTTAFKAYGNDQAQAVMIQGDGKIIAAGFAAGTTRKGNGYDFALARYNVNGSLDKTFGSGGEVTTNFTGSTWDTASYDVARAALLQPDGKIILAGITSNVVPRGNNIGLVRYNADGSLDTTFGSGGKVITSHTAIPGSLVDLKNGYGDTEVVDAAIQADGKILVSGYTLVTGAPPSLEVFVGRYNTNGTLDTTFGSGGFVTLPVVQGSVALGITYPFGHLAVEPGGEIVVNGVDQLALLHSGQAGFTDGSLDSSFGSNGIVTTPFGVGRVALEPNGDIVTGAANVTYSTGVIGGGTQVARFLPNGTPDPTFGSTGSLTIPAGADALVIQPDGKIDLAGAGFKVDRLLPGEPLIGSLSASANPVSAGSSVTLTASNITDANPGASIIQVAIFVENANGTNTLLGYGTQDPNSPGTWTTTVATTGWSSGAYTLFAQAKDSDGVLGDPFAITETVS